MLFYTGINSGMKISDIFVLKKEDVRNLDNSMKEHITVIQKKIVKQKKIFTM